MLCPANSGTPAVSCRSTFDRTYHIIGKSAHNYYYTFLQATELRRVDLVPSIIINEEREPQLESSILSMHFKVRKHHVRDSRIEVRCEATILNIYQRSRLEEIFVKTHNAETLATPNNEYEFGSGGGKLSLSFGLLLLIFAGFLEMA